MWFSVLCPEEPPRGQASPPTCCPLKMAPDWLPGRVAQSSVHHTTSSHRHRQEGKGKKSHLLHTYYVLCPGYPPHPWEDPEKRESWTHTRKRHWAGDLTAGATCLVCDRYGIKPHSLGAASNSFHFSNFTDANIWPQEALRPDLNWRDWASNQTINTEILQLRKAFERPINFPVIT